MKVDLDYIERAVKKLDYNNTALELDQGHIILDLIIELKAAREVVSTSRRTMKVIKKILELADMDLIVDINGHLIKLDTTTEILEAIKKYDEICK